MVRKLRVGSLFSGIGGFELGLERAGMEVAWQVEIEPYARRVLAKHWPDVPRCDDVRTFPPAPVKPWAVALVCGGCPCQPVSLAGHQKGEEDERWLWDDMCRVCDTLKPRWVVAENVPGLLSACDGLGRRGALFGGVLRDLAALGYVVEWHCIPAGGPGGVGAPHKRLRVWIIGHLPDAVGAGLERLAGNVNDGTEPGRIRTGQKRPTAAEGLFIDEQRSTHWDAKCRLGRATHGLPDGVDECGGWECGVDRVTTGQANRVARLKGLGNAVVPQVVELIGRAILQTEAAG